MDSKDEKKKPVIRDLTEIDAEEVKGGRLASASGLKAPGGLSPIGGLGPVMADGEGGEEEGCSCSCPNRKSSYQSVTENE